jgi:hypothetical protein
MVHPACVRLLAASLGVLGGCFDQPAASGDTGDDCTPGAAGCPCSDGVCLQGLECREIGCVDPQCVDGTLDCPCLPAGGCDAGLACAEGFCKMPPPAGTGTGPGATQGPGDESSAPTGASLDDGGDDGVTSGPGPTTTDPGMTSDEGPGVSCDKANLCSTLGEVCVGGTCEPADPYIPCIQGCADGTCVPDMPNMANVCSVGCTSDCPAIPGLRSPVCVDELCFVPCRPGVPGSCPLPMQCVLAQTPTEPSVCMWPMPM